MINLRLVAKPDLLLFNLKKTPDVLVQSVFFL